MKKFGFGKIILLSLFVAGVVLIVRTKYQNKTYTNKVIGISFDYSKRFTIVSDLGLSVVDETTYLSEPWQSRRLELYDQNPIEESKTGVFLEVIKSSKSIDDFVVARDKEEQKSWIEFQKTLTSPKAEEYGPRIIKMKAYGSGYKVERLTPDDHPNTKIVEYIRKNGDLIYVFYSNFDRNFEPVEVPIYDKEMRLSDGEIMSELRKIFDSSRFAF